MVEIPDSLVERLKARQAVLVAGLGCSEVAGAPGWPAFVAALAERPAFSDTRAQLTALAAAGRLGDALALVRDLLPHAAIEEAISRSFPDGAALPESLRLVAEFPWRAVVTTAFDDLWARALASVGDRREPPSVLVGTDVSARPRLGGGDAPLLHLFGRTALPKSLCLGPGDARTRLVPSAALAWLDHLQRRRSLVLVGFRPTDPDLVWLSSWLAAQPPPGGPHYLFLDLSGEPEPDTEAQIWALRTGLQVSACVEGTAEALARLGKISSSIRAQMPSSDAEIDLGRWLERWAADPADPEPRRMLARAEVALRDEERWDRLVELLLRRLDHQDDRREQIAALGEVAGIFRERLGAPERALTAEIVMLRLLPTDDDLWEKLRADARAAGAFHQLAAEAAQTASAAGATPEAARIWREVARIEREELGRPEQALAALEQALAASPGHRSTRDAQLELLRGLGRAADLVVALRAAAAETDEPAQAAARLRDAAEVLDRSLGDVSGAIAAHEQALAISPEDAPALAALEDLYTRERRWGDLTALLERRAARAPALEAASLRRRRAEILADRMDALGQAAEELEALAAEGDPEALRRLETIYARAERHEDHLRTLRRLADAAPNPSERAKRLWRVAAEGEARPDGLEPAASALEEILRQDPRDNEAFEALCRIDRLGGRFAALAETLSRRLEVTETAEARRALLLVLAELYENELDEPEKSLEAYQAVEAAGDRREAVYEALARSAERLERWALCADSLRRWAEVASEAQVAAEVMAEAARILIERLGDGPAAESAVGRVLGSVPEHPRALATLARVRQEAGEHAAAADLYQRAAAHEPDLARRAELLTRAAALVQDQLRDDARAVDLLTRALEADPGHAAAAERLVEAHAGRAEWAEAERLLDRAIAGTDPADGERLASLQTRLAGACLALGHTEKALACLESAYRLRPELLPLLRTFADFRFQRAEWEAAAELYGSLVRLHRAALPAAETLDVFLRLGRCRTELGQPDAAIEAYRSAKALEAEHRPTLEALSSLLAAKEDWTAWAVEREAVAALAPLSERAAIWEDIGDILAESLADRAAAPVRAEAAYRAALAAEPSRRSVIKKLLAAFQKSGRVEEAIEMRVALARAEPEPKRRGKMLYEAAQMLIQEVERPAEAIDLLESSLEDVPDSTEAFEDLARLREAMGDWKALADTCRAVLERLPADGPVSPRLRLLDRLGDLALRRLDDRSLARSALEAAVALDPADPSRLEKLAHVYERLGPDARAQAIAAHQRLVARDPHRADSFLALARLFEQTGELDKRWCVTAALHHLKKTNPALDEIYRRHRSPQVRPAREAMSEDTWRRIRHPDEDARLSELFAVGAPFLAGPAAQAASGLGLHRRAPIDLTKDESPAVAGVMALARTMAVTLPDVHRMDGETGQTTLLNVRHRGGPRPTLVLGPPTLRRGGFELVFDLAQHLAMLRPEWLPKVALRAPAALHLSLEALLALGGAAGADAPVGEAAQLKAYLQRTMPLTVLAKLAKVAARLSMTGGQPPPDLDKWLAATDLSAARAAFLLSGDLGAAARVISSEPIPTSAVPIRRRIADLVAFSVSDEYFAGRKQLGLALD